MGDVAQARVNQPQKRSNTALKIVLALFVVLGAAGAIFFLIRRQRRLAAIRAIKEKWEWNRSTSLLGTARDGTKTSPISLSTNIKSSLIPGQNGTIDTANISFYCLDDKKPVIDLSKAMVEIVADANDPKGKPTQTHKYVYPIVEIPPILVAAIQSHTDVTKNVYWKSTSDYIGDVKLTAESPNEVFSFYLAPYDAKSYALVVFFVGPQPPQTQQLSIAPTFRTSV